MEQKTRAELARDALTAALPTDYWGNLGMNEAYRRALDDMVNWIDLCKDPALVSYGKCDHDPLSHDTTLVPILRPLKDAKKRPNTTCKICRGDFSFELEAPDKKDPLFDQAAETVRRHKKVSASLLQHELKLGYVQSAGLIDQLEAAGVISTHDPITHRRKVL